MLITFGLQIICTKNNGMIRVFDGPDSNSIELVGRYSINFGSPTVTQDYFKQIEADISHNNVFYGVRFVDVAPSSYY
jgi:hypothetical protein